MEVSWLIGEEKRALETREILDWLLELPEKYGDVNFVMFSFGCDITQILRDLPQKQAWEILKQEEFEAGADGKRKKLRGPAWWREYSISYIKGKSFTVRRFRDPDNPRQINSKGELVADYSHVITIYDAFGFYASPFAKVAQSLVKPGYAVQSDVDVISANKDQRPNFHKLPLEQIKNYCELELTMLSKALTVLRDGFDKMDIHLKSWSGAGSAAGALITKQKLKDLHFSPDISKGGKTKQTAITKQQEVSHHTFIGGRIELLQQGYAPNTTLYGYDIRSAYPSAMRELPSMRGGTWERVKYPDKYQVPQDNILNMYLVTWHFPKSIKSADGKIVPLPFYPCPYRTKRGAILFPSQGKAWLMRDDVVAALRWMKCPAFGFQPKDYEFRIDEAWVFTPGNDEKPFEFIQNLYNQRATVKQQIEATGIYDILELAIKLSINSIYGKFAQRIGGSTFNPPSSACPYFASAITAQCRRKVCEAGLIEPFSIVMFATDGIVSTRELKSVGPIGEELGYWETKQIDGGIFLQSGYYSFLKSDGKAETKMRGARKANIYNPAKENMHDLLVGRVLPVWQEGKPAADFFNPAAYPVVDMEQDTYITAGSAVVSPKRWALAGRWAKLNRKTRVHTIGVKRVLDLNRIEYYWSVLNPDGSVTLAQRCSRLVPSVPAPNPTPYTLSAPNKPEWLDEIYCDGEGEEDADVLQESAETFYDLREQAEIMMKFE